MIRIHPTGWVSEKINHLSFIWKPNRCWMNDFTHQTRHIGLDGEWKRFCLIQVWIKQQRSSVRGRVLCFALRWLWLECTGLVVMDKWSDNEKNVKDIMTNHQCSICLRYHMNFCQQLYLKARLIQWTKSCNQLLSV